MFFCLFVCCFCLGYLVLFFSSSLLFLLNIGFKNCCDPAVEPSQYVLCLTHFDPLAENRIHLYRLRYAVLLLVIAGICSFSKHHQAANYWLVTHEEGCEQYFGVVAFIFFKAIKLGWGKYTAWNKSILHCTLWVLDEVNWLALGVNVSMNPRFSFFFYAFVSGPISKQFFKLLLWGNACIVEGLY